MPVRANEDGGVEMGCGMKVSMLFSAIRTKKLFPVDPKEIGDPIAGPAVNAGALKRSLPSPEEGKKIESSFTMGPRKALSPVSVLTNQKT